MIFEYINFNIYLLTIFYENKIKFFYIALCYLCHDTNITNTDIAIKIKVNQPKTFEIRLFI